MYGYIYESTNIINGMKYIGQRHGDFYTDKKYIGSGSDFKRAVKEFGRENFVKILMDTAENAEELDFKEEYYIDYFDAVKSDKYYNLTPKANGSYKGTRRSEYTKNLLREKKLGTHLSQEIKDKISKTVSSQKWITNDIIETKCTEETFEYFSEKGFVYGRLPFSEESKQHCREAFLGRHHTQETKDLLSTLNSGEGNPFYGKKHNDKTKEIMRNKKLGRKYIHKGTEKKMVYPNEIEDYLKLGWELGMGPKNKEGSTTIENIDNEKNIVE